LVVKFDSNLNVLVAKQYDGTYDDQFIGISKDSAGNIICVGYTRSEGMTVGTYSDMLIMKFDSSLNILARKTLGTAGAGDDVAYLAVSDSSNNIYVVGRTMSEGSGDNDGVIVKLDSNLNVLAKKLCGGLGSDQFFSIAIDSSGNLYACGITTSEGLGSFDALIVKFDSNLNKLAAKRYGGPGIDQFDGIFIDASNNIYVVGSDVEDTLNQNADAILVKFDSNLNLLMAKRYGGSGNEQFQNVIVDSSGNIICVGWTTSIGSGGQDALIVKFPAVIPSGTFVGTVITGLTLSDVIVPVLADSNLSLRSSNATLANSNLTFANITTLTLANSALTLTRDVINY